MSARRPSSTRFGIASLAWLLLVLTGVTACALNRHGVEHDLLLQGVHAPMSLDEPHFEVITSRDRLEALYDKISAGRLPAVAPPEIDFSRSLVLFIAMPEQSSAGHRIEVLETVRSANTLIVGIAFHHPSPEKAVATVMTQPHALVRVDRPPGVEAVRFVGAKGASRAFIRLQDLARP